MMLGVKSRLLAEAGLSGAARRGNQVPDTLVDRGQDSPGDAHVLFTRWTP